MRMIFLWALRRCQHSSAGGVREVSVQTSVYDATSGRRGRMQLVTRKRE